jgi:hypothetical protein
MVMLQMFSFPKDFGHRLLMEKLLYKGEVFQEDLGAIATSTRLLIFLDLMTLITERKGLRHK